VPEAWLKDMFPETVLLSMALEKFNFTSGVLLAIVPVEPSTDQDFNVKLVGVGVGCGSEVDDLLHWVNITPDIIKMQV
jgi:hypothetical protein